MVTTRYSRYAAAAELMAQKEQTQAQQKRAAAKVSAKKQQQKAKALQQKSLQSPEPLQTAAAHDTGMELGLFPPRQQPGAASRPKPAVVDAIRASWADQNGRVQ
ncbi:TPA: hypothetical protein ACH3X1_015371 [Trebouxia sp. C0004]